MIKTFWRIRPMFGFSDYFRKIDEESFKKVVWTTYTNKKYAEEMKNLTENAQVVRYYADKVHTYYVSIITNLNLSSTEKENAEKLKKLLKEIQSNQVIKSEPLEEYVIEIHRFMLKEVIQGLLKNSQDMVSSTFSMQTDAGT